MSCMRRPGWLSLWVSVLLVVGLSACGDPEDDAAGSEAPLPAPLDATLSVIRSGEAEQVMDLVHMMQVPCVEGRPGPSCPGGAAPGTLTEAFPVVKCELEFGTSESFVVASVERAFGTTQEVFAVATGQSLEPGWVDQQQLAGGWFAITSDAREAEAIGAGWLIAQDGKIVGLILGCDSPNQPAGSLLGFLSSPEYLVPPPGQ